MKYFSSAFVNGLKRQAFIKALDLLIDALIDFKQTYQNRSQSQSQDIPTNKFQSHL